MFAAVNDVFIEDVENLQGDDAEDSSRLESIEMRMRIEDHRHREMLTEGFECSLLSIGEILEEDQQDD